VCAECEEEEVAGEGEGDLCAELIVGGWFSFFLN
jgi:hypothetical protein